MTGFFFPVENCSATGAKNNNKRATLVFRCFPLGFLAPERVIFIVVADGTCRRRTKKVLVAQNKLLASSTCQDKKKQKNYYYTYCWEWNKKKSKAQFLSEDKPHVQSIEEEDAVAWFQPTFFGRTIWEGDKKRGRKSHVSQERTKKKQKKNNGIWLSARG